MNHPSKKNDTKLVLAIAAGTVAIAAGIGLLAQLGSRTESTPETPTAIPVSRVTEEPVTVEPIEPALPEVTVEPQIDYGVDSINSGIRAYEERRFEEAALYFAAEAEARPERAWTHYMLGLSLWKSDRKDEAAASMRTSFELEASARTAINLSRIENDRGEYDAAIAAAEQAVTLEPENGEALFLHARSLYNLGDREAALSALESSLTFDPDNAFAHNLVGLIWIERGEATLAVQALEQATAKRSDVGFIQNNYGMALELDGQLDQAVVAYSEAVRLQPSHGRAATNLARLDGRIPEEPTEAVASLQTEEIPD